MPLKYSKGLALARHVAGCWPDEADLLGGKICSWPSEVFEVLLNREADSGRRCIDGPSCFEGRVGDKQVVGI